MPTLTTIGNGAIQGAGTTLSNASVDKSASGDTLIIFDNSATEFKRVSHSGLGGGSFLGETSGGLGDIIRVHEEQLDTDVTVCCKYKWTYVKPLIVASGVTLTVSGNLSVV